MSRKVHISPPPAPLKGHIRLPGSKSISNRVLIIRALCNGDFDIGNLSDSDDSNTLLRLLDRGGELFDAGHAGTTFRFLTAYFAIQEGRQVLTGSDRMKERPIGPLVESLRTIGASINYLEKEGFPPLEILPFEKQENRNIQTDTSLSSQFVSALCLIGPYLPKGIRISKRGKMVSAPYLDMTLEIMRRFGIEIQAGEEFLDITPQRYTQQDFIVESDWSSAGYYFAIASALPGTEFRLSSLFKDSLQADAVVVQMAKEFGINTEFGSDSILLQSHVSDVQHCHFDFLGSPDLAQTIAVMAAVQGKELLMSGLDTLRHKETDRVGALQAELKKLGIKMESVGNFSYRISGIISKDPVAIRTYKDHRMAMAFAAVGIKKPVDILDPDVVSKSYPGFWKDLQNTGVPVSYL